MVKLCCKLIKGKEELVIGLYFWGGVGWGKIYLMDIFYELLLFDCKMWVYFYWFMQWVYNELKLLKGEKNLFELVLKKFVDEIWVICFDEFFVFDIGDVMIFVILMDGLFSCGVILVCIFNIVLDGLYKDGLQWVCFLLVIVLVKKYIDVVNVDGGVDYWLCIFEQVELFYLFLDEDVDVSLWISFDVLVVEVGKYSKIMEINGCKIFVQVYVDDVVWFDFKDVCDGLCSQNDYIEMVCQFYVIIISNVLVLGGEKDDQVCWFINMVDEFYDCNVKVIMLVVVLIIELYVGGCFEFEFERIEFWLFEMQFQEYLEVFYKF